MKHLLFPAVITTIFVLALLNIDTSGDENKNKYDVYQYIKDCKNELGIQQQLPVLSCLDGKQVPIYVNQQKINGANWSLLADNKKCDNPHWLGGDMGCWTYSHLQIIKLDSENIMLLNCRQKGNQHNKAWFRNTNTNLGMNQLQRKEQLENASPQAQTERYFLYNTFNDIGLILRNTNTGKSCYLTQYGDAVSGFLPPLDQALPRKDKYLDNYNPDQSRPPKKFPQRLWYRDANAAFRSPAFTAKAGCIDCHNAHGFKYSPHINSKHGLPSIYAMSKLPMLPVGPPFIKRFKEAAYLQVSTEPIEGVPQLCTQCHNMTTSGTCGYSIDFATGHPSADLDKWLTHRFNDKWMPPYTEGSALLKKHVAAMKCCCSNPHAKGCKSRKFGPTLSDLPKNFSKGGGWINGQENSLCEGIINSTQWGANQL